MKPVFTFILAAILLSSCEKKQCYTCATIFNNGMSPSTVTYDDGHCGWTKKDAENYGKENSYQWNNGGHLASTTVSCYIKK